MKKLKRIIELSNFELNADFQQLSAKEKQAHDIFQQARVRYHEQRNHLNEVISSKNEKSSDIIALGYVTKIAEYQKFIKKLEWKLTLHELANWVFANAPKKSKKNSETDSQQSQKMGKKSSSDKHTLPTDSTPNKSKSKIKEKASNTPDDLKKIEGIGVAIERILHGAGISTFQKLSKTSAKELQQILQTAGSRYKMHDPSTWAKQAKMANEGKWDALKTWQKELKGGKIIENK